MRRWRLLPLLIAVIGIALVSSDQLQADWPLYRGDIQAQGIASEALPENLKLQWEFKVENGAFEGTTAIVEDTAYIGDLDGSVFALNLADGKKKWEFETESGFYGSPAVRGGKVYIGDMDGMLYCLDAKTGKQLWQFETKAEINSSVNFYKNQILIGSQDSFLYCLKEADGSLVWKFEIEDQIRCMPTIISNRGFLAGCDGKLHVVDLDEGKAIGTVPIDGPTGSTPAAEGKMVYFGTEGGFFYAIDWERLETAWTYIDERGRQPIRTSAAITKDRAVFGGRNRKVVAIDREKGEPIWTFTARGRVDSSPVISGSRVYFGTSNGMIHGLGLEKGDELWQFEATGGFVGGPAVAQGKMIIASDDGVVYCFGE